MRNMKLNRKSSKVTRLVLAAYVIVALCVSTVHSTDSLNEYLYPDRIGMAAFMKASEAGLWDLETEHLIPDNSPLSVLIIGPGNDTVSVSSDSLWNGNIVIIGDGVLLVDNAMFTVAGQLFIKGDGKADFRNGAHLHFPQSYVGQYYVILREGGTFEATDATVEANGTMHYAQMHDSSTYIAKRTAFPDWTFRKVFDSASVILEDVDHVGDIIVTDSCYIHFTRCDTLMPWLAAPSGSIVDIEFPDPDFVDHFEFSSNVSGIEGIGHTTIIDSCSECWWSFETWPACSLIVNNSIVRGTANRIPGADSFHVSGIRNNSFHSDLLVPLSDRHIEYTNTYAYWWNWYPLEFTHFEIDSCTFGEMIGKGGSTTYARSCIHDGATITLSAIDSAFIRFEDGVSLAYVSSWGTATFLMVHSSVTPLWPYQVTNIAHDRSRFLAVNSSFVYEPQAMDTALVMFAAIDTPSIGAIDSVVSIIGSAWIDAGPCSPVEFDRYEVYWSTEGVEDWTLIGSYSTDVSHDTLVTWVTEDLSIGEYQLRLDLWTNHNDSLSAPWSITLYDPHLKLEGVIEDSAMQLMWTTCPVTASYWIYGAADNPFFVPGYAPDYEHRLDVILSDTTWISANGVENASENWTYLILAVDEDDQEVGRTNRWAEYDFLLH